MSVWTCGEAMGALRTDGPLRLGTLWTTHVAGAELNASVGLARLGHRVTWCSRLGDDDFGRLVTREARAEGVVLDVEIDPDRFTGTMQVVRQAGTSSVSYRRAGSAASAMRADELVASMQHADPAIVVLSGITPALSSDCQQGWLAVARAAHDQGRTVVVDVNHRPSLWSADQAAQTMSAVLPYADVLVGDEAELALAGAAGDLAAVDLVAIKRGAEGASLRRGGHQLDRAADPAIEVDPIGAGDAFTAGLVSGLLDQLDDEDTLARAVAMGAWAVSTPGDWEGLPTRRQLLTGRGGVLR